MVLHEGSSHHSGGYLIEECEAEGSSRVRRLVFKGTPGLSQTEIEIIAGKKYATFPSFFLLLSVVQNLGNRSVLVV